MTNVIQMPIEPTEEMLRAAKKFQCDHDDFDSWMEYCGMDAIGQYKAMMAAAPSPAGKTIMCKCWDETAQRLCVDRDKCCRPSAA